MRPGPLKRMPGWFNYPRPLGPGKPGRNAAPRPQGGKLQLFHGGRGHLEDGLAGMPDNLGRHVNEPAPHGGGIGLHGNHFPADVLLEALKEKKGRQHGVIEGRYLSKAGASEK